MVLLHYIAEHTIIYYNDSLNVGLSKKGIGVYSLIFIDPLGSVSDLTDFVTEQSRNLSIHPSLLATKWFCRKLIDIGTDCYHDNRVIEPSRLVIIASVF